jgi:hypothetical protein
LLALFFLSFPLLLLLTKVFFSTNYYLFSFILLNLLEHEWLTLFITDSCIFMVDAYQLVISADKVPLPEWSRVLNSVCWSLYSNILLLSQNLPRSHGNKMPCFAWSFWKLQLKSHKRLKPWTKNFQMYKIQT